jgi:UDP-N-acetylmuramoyl-tripeptide--D-alanyl-D-alanine ligase
LKVVDIQKIAQIVNGKLYRGEGDGMVSGCSVDSRTIRAGELFIPLRGENFDGHDFLLEAVQKGAAACLSEDLCSGLRVPVVRVEDTLTALGDLAGSTRAQFGGPVVAVTGSSGKTTTKEMLASILSLTGPGLKTEGNFNNLIGLPLTILRLGEDQKWMVLEMGTNQRGEISRLTAIADPDVGIITNVGPSHLEGLHGLDGVARAKGELFAGLKKDSFAVINADDPRVLQMPVANGVQRILFGLSPAAQIRAENVEVRGKSVSFRLILPDGEFPVRLPICGQHNVSNALAAATAALCLNVAGDLIARGLENFMRLPGRMEISTFRDDILLVDDTYNANPMSMKSALKAVAEMEGEGRLVAVLGDMLELGEESEALHREVGEKAAEVMDFLLLVGNRAVGIGQGAKDAGMAPERIRTFSDHLEAAEVLRDMLQPGDRVLLKGSRGMKMEKIRQHLEKIENEAAGEGT